MITRESGVLPPFFLLQFHDFPVLILSSSVDDPLRLNACAKFQTMEDFARHASYGYLDFKYALRGTRQAGPITFAFHVGPSHRRSHQKAPATKAPERTAVVLCQPQWCVRFVGS